VTVGTNQITGTKASSVTAAAAVGSVYSDGSTASAIIANVGDRSLSFTTSAAARPLSVRAPIAIGGQVAGQVAVDAGNDRVSVTITPVRGTPASAVAVSAPASQLSVTLSLEGAASPVKFGIAMVGNELIIRLEGATASAIFGTPRDKDLLKLIVGEATVSAVTKLRASRIASLRVVR
jgi:hypothetical protein